MMFATLSARKAKKYGVTVKLTIILDFNQRAAKEWLSLLLGSKYMLS